MVAKTVVSFFITLKTEKGWVFLAETRTFPIEPKERETYNPTPPPNPQKTTPTWGEKIKLILITFRIIQGFALVYIIIPLLCRVRRRRPNLNSSFLLFSETRYLM